MNPLFPSKILVRTGQAYKDHGCLIAADIEVDLLPSGESTDSGHVSSYSQPIGSYDTPPNGDLRNNLVLLSLNLRGESQSYEGVSMLYIFKTMLRLCRVQDLFWDPRQDLLFLCQQYGDQVQGFRSKLDAKAIQHDFLGTLFFSRLTREDQQRCYRVLLGHGPPPSMAITPPPTPPEHRHAQPRSEVPRQQLTASQSSPALNMATMPGLLSPLVPGKPRSSRTSTSDRSGSSDTNTMIHVKQSAPQRESRSRYRPVSAPNRQNGKSQDFTPIRHQRISSTSIVPQAVQDLKKPELQTLVAPLKFGQTKMQTATITAQPLQPQARSEYRSLQYDLQQQSTVFELNAATDRANVIVELPANVDSASALDAADQPRLLKVINYSPVVELDGSPVSHPGTQTMVTTSESQEKLPTRPGTLRAHSAPLSALPTSLMVGGTRTSYHQQRIVNTTTAGNVVQNSQSTTTTTTNASRYSQYHSPPTSPPSGTFELPLLTPAPLMIYKAYHPQSLPPSSTQSENQFPRPTSFVAAKDVDGAQHYFASHKREGSHASNASHDSGKLAQEYRAELPSFEQGYGSSTA